VHGSLLRADSYIFAAAVHGGRWRDWHGDSRGVGHGIRLEVAAPRLELIMLQKVMGAAVPAKQYLVALMLSMVALAGPSMAQTTFDVTSVTGTITAVVAAAAIIGAAALSMHYGIRAWKWLRGAG